MPVCPEVVVEAAVFLVDDDDVADVLAQTGDLVAVFRRGQGGEGMAGQACRAARAQGLQKLTTTPVPHHHAPLWTALFREA